MTSDGENNTWKVVNEDAVRWTPIQHTTTLSRQRLRVKLSTLFGLDGQSFRRTFST